jgi:hypothetical protein
MKLINRFIDVFSVIFVSIFFYESIKLIYFRNESAEIIQILIPILGLCMILEGAYLIFKIILFFKKLIQCW